MEDIEVVSSSDDKSQNRNLNASFSLDHLNDLLIDWSFFYELIKFMPEISRFLGIIIKMFIKEHNPPHFHAFYGEYAAVFSIETGQMIQGDLPAKKAALVIAWAIIHQKELLKNWNSLLKGSEAKKIDPLR